MGWCGKHKGGWGSPCKLDVVVSSVFCIAVFLVVAYQARRLRILHRSRFFSYGSSSVISKALFASYTFMAVVHAVLLVLVCTLKEGAGFQIFCETLYLVSWACIVVSPSALMSLQSVLKLLEATLPPPLISPHAANPVPEPLQQQQSHQDCGIL